MISRDGVTSVMPFSLRVDHSADLGCNFKLEFGHEGRGARFIKNALEIGISRAFAIEFLYYLASS